MTVTYLWKHYLSVICCRHLASKSDHVYTMDYRFIAGVYFVSGAIVLPINHLCSAELCTFELSIAE